MIPTDPLLRFQMIERMIGSLMADFDNMSQWEQDFLESIDIQFRDRKTLTDRQCEILERIFDK